MDKIFLVLLLSSLITGVLAVPFINLLYKLKFQRQREYIKASGQQVALIDRLHEAKVGTPAAGGLLVIFTAAVLGFVVYQFTSFKINWTISILALTFVLFGLLGFYDDLRKFLEAPNSGLWGIRARTKLVIQLAFSFFGWLFVISIHGF